jgi:hypothetical protein
MKHLSTLCFWLSTSLVVLLSLASAPPARAQQTEAAQQAGALALQTRSQWAGGDIPATSFRISSAYAEPAGLLYAYPQQLQGGIPVYNQVITLVFKGGQLVHHAGNFLSPKTFAGQSTTPGVAAAAAVAAALASTKTRATEQPSALSAASGIEQQQTFSPAGVARRPIEVRLVWATDKGMPRLAWNVNVDLRATPDWLNIRVDAATGQVLGQDNWTVEEKATHPATTLRRAVAGPSTRPVARSKGALASPKSTQAVTPASYRVVPFPGERPDVTTPTTDTNPWLRAGAGNNAATYGWHFDGAADYTYTRGNNVWAYKDSLNTNTPVVSSSTASTGTSNSLVFNDVPDFTKLPTLGKNRRAAVTNLFYWNNLMHDVFYQYGFTEAAGNFQANNIGRGGVGNDYVKAEAQDGSGTNNANFATPADGTSGRMQMYLFTSTSPGRDGDFDSGIICHEYGHGISHRLTGGPANASCLGNAERGDEGWSDYFSLMMTTDWTKAQLTDGAIARPVGTYVLGQSPTAAGIRRYPYSTSLSINPLTYADLSISPEVHDIGEIWCATLWDLTWALIQQQGTIEPNLYNSVSTGGNAIALQLVLQGLKLQPCQPGFLDSRDAILAADNLLYGGQYDCLIKNVFARRGMGTSAVEGSATSTSDQVAAFDGTLTLRKYTMPSIGNRFTITLEATNGCSTSGQFTLTDQLPADLQYLSSSTGGVLGSNNTVTFANLTFAANQTRTFQIVAQTAPGKGCAVTLAINDDRETNTLGGLTPGGTGANAWAPSTVRAYSGTTSWRAQDVATTSDVTLTSAAFTPASFSVLSFYHYYNTEPGYDGGLVSISTDGGTTWVDAAPYFLQNGYRSKFYGGTVSAGKPCFSGNISGAAGAAAFIQTIVDLSAFSGQSVRVRFQFQTDITNDPGTFTGWFLDDIQVLNGCGGNQKVQLVANSNNALQGAYFTPTFLTPLPAPTITTFSPTFGPVGTVVTITGTNLSGATGVTFNGVAATTFASTSATEVTATVPTGATTGLITVTTPSGTATSATNFTVTAAVATVVTTAPGTVTGTSAVLGGSVTATGGTSITDRGVVYVVGTGTPTTSDTKVTIGANTGVGTFSQTITGLRGNTTYTVRAYATNSAGTAYGANQSFTTPNNPPTATADAVTVAEDSSPTVISVLANDNTLPDVGETLTIVSVTQPANGTVTINAGASVSFTPALNFNGVTSFTYTISDGNGGTATATVTVTVTPVNDAPVVTTTTGSTTFMPGAGPVAIDNGLTVADVDNTTLASATVSITGGFQSGQDVLAFTNNNASAFGNIGSGTSGVGSLALISVGATATVAQWQAALRAVTFNNTSGSPSTSTRTVAFMVNDGALNSAATTKNVSFTAAATTTIVSITANGPSPTSASTLSYTVTFATPVTGVMGYNFATITSNLTGFSGASVTGSGTTYVVTVNTGTVTNSSFPSSFQIRLDNSTGISPVVTNTGFNSPTYIIDRTAPTAAISSSAGASGGSTSTSPIPFAVLFSESVTGFSAAGISVSNGLVTPGSLSGSGTTYTFSVTPTAAGVVQVSVLANGAQDAASNGNIAAGPYTLTYAQPTQAPTVTNLSPATGPVGTQVTITGTNLTSATAVRFNGTAASSFVVNSATSITAVVAAGTTTGLVSVTTPGGTATSTTSFVVRVAPTTVADAYTVQQGATLTGNVLANDLGTNPVALLIIRPTHGTLLLNPDGSFTYQPAAGYVGPDSFIYYACDPGLPLLCGNPVTVSITVGPASGPTLTLLSPATGPVGTQVTITGTNLTGATAVRFNGTVASSFVVNSATSITAVVAAGTTTGPVQVTTPSGTATSAMSFVVRIPPTTVADTYSTPQNVTLTGNVLANDLGTNPVALLIIRPTHGTLALNPDGSFTYQPATGYTGPDSFIYYACDPSLPLLCGNPATVSITVGPTPNTLTAAKTSPKAGAEATPALTLTGSPNPFAEQLWLTFILPATQAYTLAVYDAQGRLVQQLASGEAPAGQAQQVEVPTHTYAEGLYLLRLTTASGTQLLKLVKQQ